MKKAFDWLENAAIPFTFHDYKKEPPTEELLTAWLKKNPSSTLINTKGTTWKQLPEALKNYSSQELAIALMIAKPSVIKRPVLVLEKGDFLIGFEEERWAISLL